MGDERDWTAIQTRRCPQCGFDPAVYSNDEISGAIVSLAAKWRDAVDAAAQSDPAALRRRPTAEVWAPLEYACHVRDLLAVFTGRVERMLRTDDAELGWWDHEAAPEDTAYLRQDPAVVAATIYAAGCGLAAVTARVGGGDWARIATRRPGEEFTLVGLLKFALHEMHHHLLDFSAG